LVLLDSKRRLQILQQFR